MATQDQMDLHSLLVDQSEGLKKLVIDSGRYNVSEWCPEFTKNELVVAAANNRNVTQVVWVVDDQFTPANAAPFLELLKKPPIGGWARIEYDRLCNQALMDSIYTTIFSKENYCPKLKSVNVIEPADSIGNSFSLGYSRGLDDARIQICMVGEDGHVERSKIMHHLKNHFENHPTLECLVWYECDSVNALGTTRLTDLLSLCQSCKQLHEVSIQNGLQRFNITEPLLDTCFGANLKKLELGSFDFGKVRKFSTSTNDTLTEITLYACSFTQSAANKVLAKFTGLRRISLIKCTGIESCFQGCSERISNLDELTIDVSSRFPELERSELIRSLPNLMEYVPQHLVLIDHSFDQDFLSNMAAGLDRRAAPLVSLSLTSIPYSSRTSTLNSFKFLREHVLPKLKDLERLTMQGSNYRIDGEFCRFLESIFHFKKLQVFVYEDRYYHRSNNGVVSEETAQMLKKILMKGFSCNFTLTGFDVRLPRDLYDAVEKRTKYYLRWNRLERPFTQQFPLGVWPHALEHLLQDKDNLTRGFRLLRDLSEEPFFHAVRGQHHRH